MRESIFYRSKTTQLNMDIEFSRVFKLFFNELCVETYNYTYSFAAYIDKEIFLKWKHREGSLSIQEYLGGIVNMKKEVGFSEIETLLFFEFIFNIILFSSEEDRERFRGKAATAVAIAILENIKRVVERLNMEIVDVKEGYIIVSKDEEADAAAEAIPELRELIFEYNDIKNMDDIMRKKEILKHLGDYHEGMKMKLESNKADQTAQLKYYGLSDDVRFLLNNINIRHNNTKDKIFKSLSEHDVIHWYNIAYKLLLQCFMAEEHLSQIQNIKKLKEIDPAYKR